MSVSCDQSADQLLALCTVVRTKMQDPFYVLGRVRRLFQNGADKTGRRGRSVLQYARIEKEQAKVDLGLAVPDVGKVEWAKVEYFWLSDWGRCLDRDRLGARAHKQTSVTSHRRAELVLGIRVRGQLNNRADDGCRCGKARAPTNERHAISLRRISSTH